MCLETPVQLSAMAVNKSIEEALRDVIRLAPFAGSELSTSSGPAGLPLGYYITVLRSFQLNSMFLGPD